MSYVPVLNDQQEVLERFRHGSVLFDNDTKLFFYGGKRSEGALSSSIILNDAFVLDINSGQLVKIQVRNGAETPGELEQFLQRFFAFAS